MPDQTDSIFAEIGLSPTNFEIRTGGGKSFVSGQRVIWMEITCLSTGRKTSGKLGTSKKNTDRQRLKLLRSLLTEFR